MAYQQLLSQQRGLSAFGHTSPLVQPPPTFSAHQLGLGLSSLPTSAPDTNLPAKVTTFHSYTFLISSRLCRPLPDVPAGISGVNIPTQTLNFGAQLLSFCFPIIPLNIGIIAP